MSFADAVNAKAIDIGKLAVEMTTAAGSGHPSTALSLCHLTTVLMYHQMRYDPKRPSDPGSDRFVLSEGHAVPIVYAACADLGVAISPQASRPGDIDAAKRMGGVADTQETHPDLRPMTRDDAMTLRAIDSAVDGHPHPQVGFPFFDAATGSLGQGLSVAAGIGFAARLDGADRIAYCIIGDGESREGQIWEACDFIVDHALTNVVAIFNCNSLAQSDYVSPQQSSEVLADKLAAYGFVVRIIDGHDPESIKKTFDELPVIRNGKRPLAIVAETVKGWGTPDEQGMGKHGKPVSKDKLQTITKELDETAADLGVEGYEFDGDLKIQSPPDRGEKFTVPGEGDIKAGDFMAAMEAAKYGDNVKKGKLAPRKAYGAALLALGAADDRIVGLDCDVKNSTYAELFAKKYQDRFAECRIAEQNMIGVAGGLSAAGKIPFCSTFAKFFVRAYDQIEMAIIGGANIKMTGSHAGVTLASDGPSQMSLTDAAFFRSLAHAGNFNGAPSCRYFFPADAVSCYRLTELMANLDGCCYQRTIREDLPTLYGPDETDFATGGHRVIREGSDLLFVSAGYMVHECLAAADAMGKGRAGVVDAYSFPMSKPEEIIALAEKSGGRIVTVEDNYSGGLDAEIGIALAKSGSGVKLTNLVVKHVPKSGRTPDDVLEYLDLGKKQIVAAVS